MGRSQRHDPDEGWHHVMNRGAARQQVFFTAGDGRCFERLVGEACEATGVEVHAYCLMSNHFHLLVKCPSGGLSPFMQRIGSGYTKYLNWRLERDGPIFRGRFHSILVDEPEYLQIVGRYVHRNPLDVRPPVALDRYRWSSYCAYVGGVDGPSWLRTGPLLSMHASPVAYRAFVDDDVRRPCSPGVLRWAIETAVGELCDELDNPAQLVRTVGVALLGCARPSLVATVEQWFEFPTPTARTMAQYRARMRTERDPVVGRVVTRTLELVA